MYTNKNHATTPITVHANKRGPATSQAQTSATFLLACTHNTEGAQSAPHPHFRSVPGHGLASGPHCQQYTARDESESGTTNRERQITREEGFGGKKLGIVVYEGSVVVQAVIGASM